MKSPFRFYVSITLKKKIKLNHWCYSSKKPRPTEEGCCQMAEQGTLWLAKCYPSTLISVFLTRFCYFLYQVATQLAPWGWVDPAPDPILQQKFLRYSRESNPGPVEWQSAVLTTIPNNYQQKSIRSFSCNFSTFSAVTPWLPDILHMQFYQVHNSMSNIWKWQMPKWIYVDILLIWQNHEHKGIVNIDSIKGDRVNMKNGYLVYSAKNKKSAQLRKTKRGRELIEAKNRMHKQAQQMRDTLHRVEGKDIASIAVPTTAFRSRQHYVKCRKGIEEVLPNSPRKRKEFIVLI